MPEFHPTHSGWVILAMLIIVTTVAATVYAFWRRRYIDSSGPQKTTAANPAQVRRDNPPDH